MAVIDPNANPLVWESHDIRFTVDPCDGLPAITLLGAHTDEQSMIAQRATKAVLDSSRFVPLNDAGFEWMAYAIRLAWSEARVVKLQDMLANADSANLKIGTRIKVRVAELQTDAAIKARDIKAMMLAWGQAVQHAADNRKEMLGFAPEMLQGPIDEIIVLHQKFAASETRVAEVQRELDTEGAHLLLARLSEAQLGSDYRCVARKLREIAGAVPLNPERYAIIDGEVCIDYRGEGESDG